MSPTTRTHANRQPFEPADDDFERAVAPLLERALDDGIPEEILRFECRTDDGTAFVIELDTATPQDAQYAWNLSRGPPSPAPSTYYVLDQGRQYVLVAAKADTQTELIQEANYLLHSIGGPDAQLVELQLLHLGRNPGSRFKRLLRRLFNR